MSVSHLDASEHLKRLLSFAEADRIGQLLSKKEAKLPPRVPGASLTTPESIERRWRLLELATEAKTLLCDEATLHSGGLFARNIENLIGTVKVPVGLIGPLRVNGMFAQKDFYVPLATTEAALVASYHRGAMLISESGGASVAVLAEGVSRAPGFAFKTIFEAGSFVAWAVRELETFRQVAEATTSHGKLIDMRVTLEGNHVYLNFEYLTGDAAGQNMVTIATQAVCDHIAAHSPIQPDHAFVEANLSGDKKASSQSFQSVRGRKVTAEAILSAELIAKRLHTTPEKMAKYWRMSALGGVMSGTIGVQGHYANGLAALYIACGQDAACVAESSVGVTRFETTADGGLYASVTLPNLIVGTVGGGTSLPSQRACLEIMGLAGTGHARALAEVTAAVALAGELSIIGALSAQQFSRAHAKRARGTTPDHAD